MKASAPNVSGGLGLPRAVALAGFPPTFFQKRYHYIRLLYI